MHGNTETTSSGVKTRRFDAIISEMTDAFKIHVSLGGRLGGVHCELTGDPVTETMGGSSNLSEQDLSKNYQTFCDPRYNFPLTL
jgi:3-deoxy-7-phosphoheptulonate synthase